MTEVGETWSGISHKHRVALRDERVRVLRALASAGLTQTQAAQRLGTSLNVVNNFIAQQGIAWPVIRQGVKLT